MREDFNKQITVVKCACGDAHCSTWGLSNGTFYQGSGWDKETADRLVACWNLFTGVGQLLNGADVVLAAVEKVKGIIADAEASGVTIDDGNVVDLIADNTEASLPNIRAALIGAGLNNRFPKAIGFSFMEQPNVKLGDEVEQEGGK